MFLAAEGIQNLQEPTNALRLLVVPGRGKSEYTLYEDDETTQSYEGQDYAFTRIAKNDNGSRLTITIYPRQGSYANAPSTRQLTIEMEGVEAKPAKVLLNGKAIDAAINVKSNKTQITLSAISSTVKTTIEIEK